MMGIILAHCGNKDENDTATHSDNKNPPQASNTPEEKTFVSKSYPPPISMHGFVNYSTLHGLPTTVYDVSADETGNIWAAGYEALYLLRPESTGFEELTEKNGLQKWKVLSVAGLGPNEVMVGYEGVFGGKEDNDPQWMVRSGGVDRLQLAENSMLQGTHYVIHTPADEYCHVGSEGDACYNGRYKIRNVYIIRPLLSGPFAGDIWFGGNHGVAMWNEKQQKILEHQHCAIEGIDTDGSTRFFTGDFWGLAIAPDNNVWIGGAHRVARIPYSPEGEFFAAQDPIVDVWPDSNNQDRVDDHVKAITVATNGDVWIGSVANNLARYSPSTNAIEYFDKSKGAPDQAVTALAADPDGTIWVGSYVGIGRYNPATKEWTYYYHRTHGLADDSISSLQIDTRTEPRTVYIGTSQGVSVYQGP
jgi:ligand-binding sensor domain-containing protein